MLATQHGVALIRRASPEPANDNVRGAIVPDHDRPFFLALGLICAGVLLLVAYMAMGGSDDVMSMLKR